jgi:dihydrofolate reductase
LFSQFKNTKISNYTRQIIVGRAHYGSLQNKLMEPLHEQITSWLGGELVGF